MKSSTRRLRLKARDHPVAPRPHLAHAVVLVAVRIGVARDVEPVGGHALAVGRRRQQAIDDALVGVGGAVGEERVDLGRRRRQAGQVEGHAPQPGLARRLGRRLPALRLERGQHEPIDLAACPAARGDRRQRRRGGRDERPVRLPLGALFDPADQRRLLDLVEREVRIGRRHHHLGVGAGDAADQLALGRAARHDGAMARLQRRQRRCLHVEPQPALALPVVRTVALEAAVREERLDVEVEVDPIGHTGDRRRLPAAGTAPSPRLSETSTEGAGAPEGAGTPQGESCTVRALCARRGPRAGRPPLRRRLVFAAEAAHRVRGATGG